MRVIIAGSRGYAGRAEGVAEAVRDSGFDVTCVISGTAAGADVAGEHWARLNKIQVERYPADWKSWGKAAGHIRNTQMAEAGDALIALWDGKSRGTEDMIRAMELRRKPVFVRLFT